MAAPRNYKSISLEQLMDLLKLMRSQTKLPGTELTKPQNSTLHMIHNLMNFMMGIDDENKYFMSVPFWCIGEAAQRKARNNINIHQDHWIVNKNVRDKLLAQGLL